MLPLLPAVIAWHGPAFGGLWWLGFLTPLFWIAVVVLVIALVRRGWRRGGPGPWAWHDPSHAAEQTLAERFARGDIDEREYRARLEVLRASRVVR